MNNAQTQMTSMPLKRKSAALSAIPGVNWLLFIIPALYMLLLTFIPILRIMKLGVHDGVAYTAKYLIQVFTTPVYLKVIVYTFKVSFTATLITLLLGYPVAYLLYKIQSEKWQRFTMSLIMIPFWISVLIRTFTWMIMLQEEGVINKVLLAIGVINQPLHLLYSTTGNVIGMVHYLFPYMVLCIYSVMKGIDGRLLQAAEGMGARPWRAFRDVMLPLSMPGVIAGVLISFVFSLGFFITGVILGGPKDKMISNLIANFINVTLNWHLAAALSIILLGATILLIAIPFVIFRKHSALKGVI
ncbi:ABC transporter permease subunit [Paenibacillus sp. LMG 31458]|uniref:ABC transporter permease subunit n=1 Tax=Paenibacillus phytorum TaxID=2654977 RepID=A0ABX1Y1H4_9BACL|nr:ABC transporter permease [Paenibacillus phytorum]NOU74459.1 ABC transporter permease subunit [Paenibacillus phytorum]